MYVSFREPSPTRDDGASLAVFRRRHGLAVVAYIGVVAIVIVGPWAAFNVVSAGSAAPPPWQLSPTQGSVAYLALWALTFVAVCLVPFWRYAMLRQRDMTQSRVLRRLQATSLISFGACGTPAPLASALFILNARSGVEWLEPGGLLAFPLLSLFLLFAYLPDRSRWEARLRAAPPG